MSSNRELIYKRNLSAFHRLSERVAHDINNLLSGISGYTELLLLEPSIDPLKYTIEEIRGAGKRIASLTQLLSAFSDKYAHHPVLLDLNEPIAALKGFVTGVLGKGTEYLPSHTDGLWPVRADLARMKLALIMLAIEMKDLMPDGGKLAVSAVNRTDIGASGAMGPQQASRVVLVTAVASGRIAVDKISDSLLNASAGVRSDDPASEIPGLLRLVQSQSGYLTVDSCSALELQASIHLPAADPELSCAFGSRTL